jgi:hypothetical protein
MVILKYRLIQGLTHVFYLGLKINGENCKKTKKRKDGMCLALNLKHYYKNGVQFTSLNHYDILKMK